MGVCTTRQWHTSDRLVPELNGCTVYGAVYIVVCVCLCVCVCVCECLCVIMFLLPVPATLA